MSLQDRFLAASKRSGLLGDGDRVLVAVSGGPDSVALLHLLDGLRQEFALHLEIAHVEHGIRGAESKQDALFVGELAATLDLDFHLKELDLATLRSAEGAGNIEALARRERYRFFGEIARQRRLDKIATGHTGDDQAETVLMWFLRGSGLTGLAGIAPVRRLGPERDGPLLIRPLLRVSKPEILDFLAEKQQSFCIDGTNQDPALLRNWIRLHLLPELGRRGDSRLGVRLAAQAALLRDEDEFLQAQARKELATIRTLSGLDRNLLLKLHPALERRALRLWIEENRGDLTALDSNHIENLLALVAEGPPQGRLSIPGDWELIREYDFLRFEKRCRRGAASVVYSYELPTDGLIDIPQAGMSIRSERVAPVSSERPKNRMEAIFDASAIRQPLLVRNFRPGDRFIPIGMTGHKKLKELFTEKRVPQSRRRLVPIVTMGEEVLWIPGYGRSATGLIDDHTGSILRLSATGLRR